MFETIKYEVKNKIAWITLNRPERLNAFTEQLNREVKFAIKQSSKDETVRTLVITGQGRAFCSGEDLAGVTDDMDLGDVLRQRYNPMLKELDHCEKPIVAAVNGVAAGAGMSLSLACDFRIASDHASFVQSFVHVGLIPDAGNLYYLTKMVGHAKALELAVFGDKITAQEAFDLGLVTKIIPATEWSEGVEAFASKLANMPTKAIGLIKRNLKASWDVTFEEFLEKDAEGQRLAGLTNDHKEGIQAFMEKRKPVFKGY
ncbi:enoyl-CoA hydratase-related protein [Ferdinandcohnia quinoae]|uniref:Enoyl-CoA hydratase-related protein n=1 Tax=Fredinandcohnia quinoae TaxID=2918902 RepID=A0AAW5EAV9_9BACI|nr:enoyl-CoA hydratase-related protein [Fredinandcohnia sp. SECRCQ15]MCH1626298.1 enoyl-CoA hydratase-related protein [Fredinandcohnia sp. SECRCQ15]